MQGNYAFCKKHGHDWKVTGYSSGMFYCECSICGAKQVRL